MACLVWGVFGAAGVCLLVARWRIAGGDVVLLGCDRAGGLVLRWAMWGCALWVWVGMAIGVVGHADAAVFGKRKRNKELRRTWGTFHTAIQVLDVPRRRC